MEAHERAMEAVNTIKRGIHNWYYPVVLLTYVLALINPGVIRPGVVSAFFVCLVSLEAILMIRSADRSDTCGLVLVIWFIYNLLSGIWCVGFGMPVSVYLGELFTTALPMLFFIPGRKEAGSLRFSVNYLISVVVIGVLGIILFITGPKFYIDYLMELQLISKADIPTMRVRMHSVIGSTLMGFLPSLGMLISVRLLISAKKKVAAVSFVLMLFLAFMSNQRSAMAAAILILIYLNILVFFSFKIFPIKYFFGECIVGALAVGGFFVVFHGAFLKVYRRLISLPGSIAQRSDQWVGAANNMKSIWLGNGLGANGHRAIGYTEHLIADGGLAKLYVESGIIGTSIFVFLILLVLKRGFSNIRKTAPETGIVLITLLTSIGSNMMSFALSVPVFYYYMGALVREASAADPASAPTATTEGGEK